MRVRRAVVVVAGVGLGLVCLLLMIGARVPRDAVVAAAERTLGRPLRIREARLRFLPQPAVEILDVQAPDAGIVAGCVTAFEAERIRLRLAVGPLVRGRAVVEGMDVEAPLLRLLRPSSEPTTAAPGEAPMPAARAATKGTRRRAGRTPSAAGDGVTVRLANVRVRGGRVQFFDEATTTRWALGQIGAGIELSPGVERADVKVRAVLRRRSRKPLAGLDLRGVLRWQGGTPRFRGRVTTGEFQYGPLWLDGSEARLQADEAGLHLRDLVLRLGGGALGGRARVLLGDHSSVALALGGNGNALEDAFENARVMVHGDWRMALAVRGPAPWRTRARRGLRGGGRIVVRDGSIEPFELGAAVLDVVAPLRGREQSQQLRSRYPDLFNERRLRFRRLTGSMQIASGRVRTRQLLLLGEDYRADVGGTVSFDGKLDLTMQLATSARLAEDLLGDRGLAAMAGAAPGQPFVVPLEIGGSVERPRIRATQDWSRDVIRRALGGSGMGDLLERLLR